MAKKLEKKQLNSLIIALAYLIIGVLFIVFKAGILGLAIQIALTVLGVLFIVFGILGIVNKRLVEGIVNLVIGVVIIVFGWTLLMVIMIIFGVL
ncbi:MAG: hypothetical protein MJ248_04760, partial [Bacilli bacterium]|nr:hypothetical protein [Bacilli bacterium]